jgi:Glycosyl transferase family 2
MTLKVRDEADIIEDNLRYHLAQGIDFFVIADTGSTDGTVEVLEPYQRAGIVRLERIGRGIHDMKEGGEEEITRIAGEMGADWVIHNDADEFWWPLTGGLKEAMATIPEGYGLVVAPRAEFVVRPGDGPFADRLTIRETRFLRPPKSAHRAHPQVAMRGPHPVEIWVDRSGSPYTGLVGKPVLRTEAEHAEEDGLELLIAPTFPVRVLHFPFRSFAQYKRRVEIARGNGQLDRNAEGRRVRDAYEAGRLEEIYRRLALDDQAVAAGIDQGWLIEDTDFRDYLAACPDGLSGGEAPPGAHAWPQERRHRELAELEHDGMYAISRYLQTHAYRTQERRRQIARHARAERRLRRQVRQLQKRARRQRERLRKIESSRWWRLRPRVPSALSRLRSATSRRR